ncbi:MAG: hypothetical protein JO119_21585 [Acidobacteria bacterium]|nr:hypothetical protein [Acidobacteriota bacterium]
MLKSFVLVACSPTTRETPRSSFQCSPGISNRYGFRRPVRSIANGTLGQEFISNAEARQSPRKYFEHSKTIWRFYRQFLWE